MCEIEYVDLTADIPEAITEIINEEELNILMGWVGSGLIHIDRVRVNIP